MIAVVSSAARERAALISLCESRGWPVIECDSVGALRRALSRHAPRVVLARHQLADGYSDDVLAHLRTAHRLPETKVIVMVRAGTPSALEARQLTLGADCVQRDPVRIEVLVEYLAKYHDARVRTGRARRRSSLGAIRFAGATLRVPERELHYRNRSVQLTPRETQLAELLVQFDGEVLTYETLFSELLGRRFRGDTSNMRVLFGKLSASAATLGIALRSWIAVIAKGGYRYQSSRAATGRRKKPGPRFLSAA